MNQVTSPLTSPAMVRVRVRAMPTLALTIPLTVRAASPASWATLIPMMRLTLSLCWIVKRVLVAASVGLPTHQWTGSKPTWTRQPRMQFGISSLSVARNSAMKSDVYLRCLASMNTNSTADMVSLIRTTSIPLRQAMIACLNATTRKVALILRWCSSWIVRVQCSAPMAPA